MKHSIFFAAIFLALFLFSAQNTFAALGTLRSFGGKIISTEQPGVLCAAQYGVITIRPIGGLFPPTPYVIEATRKTVSPGGWILGLYNPALVPGPCYTDSFPPVPYPTFNIIKFGTSKGLSF
jgi:hypothetical protein